MASNNTSSLVEYVNPWAGYVFVLADYDFGGNVHGPSSVVFQLIFGFILWVLYAFIIKVMHDYRKDEYKNPFYTMLKALAIPDLYAGAFLVFYQPLIYFAKQRILGDVVDIVICAINQAVPQFTLMIHFWIACSRFVAIVAYTKCSEWVTDKTTFWALLSSIVPALAVSLPGTLAGMWTMNVHILWYVPSRFVPYGSERFKLAYYLNDKMPTIFGTVLSLAICGIYLVTFASCYIRYRKFKKTNPQALESLRKESKLLIQGFTPLAVGSLFLIGMILDLPRIVMVAAAMIYAIGNPVIYLILDRRLRNHSLRRLRKVLGAKDPTVGPTLGATTTKSKKTMKTRATKNIAAE